MNALRSAAAYGDGAFDLRAFGIIGSAWSQILQAWTTDAKNLVDSSADAGNQIAAAMREMAASYTAQDGSSAQSFQQISDGLGGQ
jgi:hypothetical protein